jgi:hypothetical protein
MLASGGYGDNSNIGAVWIFQRDSSNVWSQLGSKISGPITGTTNYFGTSVSFNGNGSLLGICSYDSNPNIGMAFIYQNVSNVYQFLQNIVPRDTSNVGFGDYGNAIQLDKSGLTFILGVSSDNDYTGSAQIFTKCYT